MIEGTAAQNQFFITLPSNSSETFYGRQHPSNYHTRLETSIRLDPETWEVGLAEIAYPKTWHNVKSSGFALVTPQGLTVWTHLRANKFVSSEHLIRELQWSLDRAVPRGHNNKVVMRYDDVSERLRITIERGYALNMPRALAVPLGLTEDNGSPYRDQRGDDTLHGLTIPKDTTRDTVVEGAHTVYIDRAMPTMYVYCDLVRRARVGDAYVPLLRTLTVPERVQGDVVERQFTNIHYGTLERGIFDSVEIHIVDSTGANVPFEHGDVIVKLHFRRKQ